MEKVIVAFDPFTPHPVAYSPAAGAPQPIATDYSGYRFRSRTEARWAVFLDAIGLRWAYELRAFDLPSGRYLPDFWLPGMNTWIEVKPGAPNLGTIHRARELAAREQQWVLIAHGAPGVDTGLTAIRPVGPDDSAIGSGYYWLGCTDQCNLVVSQPGVSKCARCGRHLGDDSRQADHLLRAYHQALRFQFD